MGYVYRWGWDKRGNGVFHSVDHAVVYYGVEDIKSNSTTLAELVTGTNCLVRTFD